MARVNVGVNPKYLNDNWLIAESVEITMITGSLRKNNFEIKSDVPDHYKLGTGHINFFKNKLVYLRRRLIEVNKEMVNRGFKPGTYLNLNQFPKKYHNDWTPTMSDSRILRDRLIWKVNQKPYIWRYRRKKITKPDEYKKWFDNSELYFV